MKITYIVTVNPIIPLKYLNLLVHSLNMQTVKDFDVIFYNQTKLSEQSIRDSLATSFDFEFSFFHVPPENFFGQYPLWDLYGTHQALLDENRLSDYFMSLHMEEFLDPTYTQCALSVLRKTRLDILLGNLHSTPYGYDDVSDLLSTTTAQTLAVEISRRGSDKFVKWGMTTKPFFVTRSMDTAVKRAKALSMLKWRKQLSPTQDGFTVLGGYLLEDIFFMSTEFAKRMSWYACQPLLYFEDIHINGALGTLLPKITTFPAYLNTSKAYHLEHGRYYYQLEDAEFADTLLALETDNEALKTLKEAIQLYRGGSALSVDDAVRMSRQNTRVRGVSDISVGYHKKMIMRVLADEEEVPNPRRAV